MGEECGLDSSGLEQRPVAGCFQHGNEPSGFLNGGFVFWLTESSVRF
jgi:hypothetical protein